MAIEFVSSASENATSISAMPTHQAGDILVFAAFRFGNSAAPTLPSGLVGAAVFGVNNINTNIAYRVAASSGETSGTFTNASALACLVYRASAGEVIMPFTPQNGIANATSSTTMTLNYASADRFASHITGSWYFYLGMTTATDSSIETAPTGLVTRESRVITSVGEWIVADTNGDPGVRPNLATSVGGTAATWRTMGASLAYFPHWPSGSGGLPVGRIISGGV